MSFWSRITGRRDAPERRWGGDDGFAELSAALGGGGGERRGAVSTRQAEGLSAVTACVELICGAISSLPASLTVDGPAGSVPAPATAPAWALLRYPNERQTWPAFMQELVASILLRGAAVAWIETDGRGAVSKLTFIPWEWLLPLLVPDGAGGLRLVFDVPFRSPIIDALGLPRRLLDGDVLHIKARSDNGGLIGRSVLSRAAGPVREAMVIEELASATWRNGMRPSGAITSPTYLTETQRARKAEWLAEFTGAMNTGKVPVLEGGWTFNKLSMSSVDAEFLASRQFSLQSIARLFCVPEPLLQVGQRLPTDMSTFSTLFAQQCLAPLVALICAEFGRSVLPVGMRLSLDLDHLVRGSFSATVAALAALKQSGIISANDARAELGWSAHPDGDVLGVGLASAWPADFKGGTHLSQSPGPTGDGPPAPNTHGNEGAAG